MVTKHSAVPSKPTEDPHDQLSRNVDHSGISRFQDRSDQDYRIIQQRIIDCTKVDTTPFKKRYLLSPISPIRPNVTIGTRLVSPKKELPKDMGNLGCTYDFLQVFVKSVS